MKFFSGKTRMSWAVGFVACLTILMAVLMLKRAHDSAIDAPEKGQYQDNTDTEAVDQVRSGEPSNQAAAPAVLDSGLINNGFEPDDGAPIPTLEDQVRNNKIIARVEFPEENMSVTRHGEYDYVRVEDALNGMSEPGSPDLPLYSINLLIPRGRVVEGVRFQASEVPWKQDVLVAPSQPPQPSDGSPAKPFMPPDESVYGVDALTPAVLVEESESQGVRGYKVVPIQVRPVRYNPVSKELSRITSMKVLVSTRDMTDEERKQAFMPKSNEYFDQSVKSIVLNPGIMDIQIGNL